ncbi:hypothetical protein CR513_59896, partial [Mucuna pruriens]
MLSVTEKEKSYTTEFRAYKDDAWYSVCVLLEGETLRVKYLNFSDENDDVFEASLFQNCNDLQNLKERFRPPSKQLQDAECRQLPPNAKVCACHPFSHDDVRFYDALIDGVQEREHSWETGEESCSCTFILFWLHGPNARNLTSASIENICVVQPAWELDPVVASFLEVAREKIKLFSSRSVLVSKGVSASKMVPYCYKSSDTTLRMGYVERMEKKASILQNRFQFFHETRRARRSVFRVCSPEVSCDGKRMEDRDLEVTKNMCMILIANIDKELCPSAITEFLRMHTSISAGVYIFPSLSFEVYTRGAIMVDSLKDFQVLCDFLNNPNCMVTSSTDRPWVILEKLVGFKSIKASIGALEHVSKTHFTTIVFCLLGSSVNSQGCAHGS